MKFKWLALCIVFICMILIFPINPGYSANYYVKNGGNDHLDGLSDANAWATIHKVNTFAAAHSFRNGDTINFNRGDTWSGDQAIGMTSYGNFVNWGTINGLTIQDYGSGAKPYINCETQMAIGINASGVSNLTIKNIQIAGAANWSSNWYFASAIYIYNVTGVTLDGIDGNGRGDHPQNISGASFQALEIRHCGGNIEVKNCDIHDYGPATNPDPNDTDDTQILVVENYQSGPSGTCNIHDNTFYNVHALLHIR